MEGKKKRGIKMDFGLSKDDEFMIRNEFDLLDIIYKIDIVFINEKTKKEFLEEIKKEGVTIE